MQLNMTEFEKAIHRSIILDMKRFIHSRDRREEWIPSDTSLCKVNWSSWMDFLPSEFDVDDVIEYVNEYESKHGEIECV